MNAHNRNGEKVVTAGFVLGLIGIVGWFIPRVGFPVTIVGLIMSVRGKSKEPEKKGLATAGLVLNIIFLVATIVNSAIGAYNGHTVGH